MRTLILIQKVVKVFGALATITGIICIFFVIWSDDRELPAQIALTCVLSVLILYLADEWLEKAIDDQVHKNVEKSLDNIKTKLRAEGKK
jgi:uncharacterized membrane protein YqjE